MTVACWVLLEFCTLKPKVLSRVRKSYVNEWTPAHAAVQEFRRFSAHEHSFGPTLSLVWCSRADEPAYSPSVGCAQ